MFYAVSESNDSDCCISCNNEIITLFSTLNLANAYKAASVRSYTEIHTITLDDVNSKIYI